MFTSSVKLVAPQLNTCVFPYTIEDFLIINNIFNSFVSSSVPVLSNSNDVVLSSYTSSISHTTGSIVISSIIGTNNTSPTLVNLTPSLLTINSDGTNVSASLSGTAILNITLGRRRKRHQFPVVNIGSSIVSTFNSIVEGSLSDSASKFVDANILSKSPSPTTINLYSSYNAGTLSFVRNSSQLWASGSDFTCIPVYNSQNQQYFNGILVAPDVLIQANHAHSTSGSVMYFVDNNNTTISSSVGSGQRIGITDIWVAKLGNSVSSSITPAKVFSSGSFFGPSGSYNITSVALINGGLPVIFTNQFATLKIGELQYVTGEGFVFKSTNVSRILWYSAVISGDSGSPLLSVIGNQTIAIGTWHTSNLSTFSTAPLISMFVTDINSAMSSLGSIFTLTTASLVDFPTY